MLKIALKLMVKNRLKCFMQILNTIFCLRIMERKIQESLTRTNLYWQYLEALKFFQILHKVS